PAVLHDQADRRGHRARAVDQLRHRDATARRHDRGRQPARRIYRIHRALSARRSGEDMSVSILIVDDEADVADLFRQRFRRETRDGTYVLHFAYSGEEALAKLDSEIDPQLIVILSDINMPGMHELT